MANIRNQLADLFRLGVATAGTASAPLALAMASGSTDPTSLATCFATAAAATGAGYLTNKAAADPTPIVESWGDSDDLLRNGDWLKLAAKAAAEIIRQHSRDDASDAEKLTQFADPIC